MKKITLWLFALFTCWQISAQTGTIVVGVNDGTPNTTTGDPSPLQDYYKTQRIQFLYTAAELSSAGLVAGNITSLGWVATALNASTLQENYTISMKSTTSTVLTTTFETGATVVYGPTDFTPSATGNVVFTLTTPFVWNGTSNILVELCAGLASGGYTENVSCANSTTVGTQTVYYRNDDATAPCTTLTGTTTNQRPLLVLTGNVASCLAPTNIVSGSITSTSAAISWDAVTPTPTVGYEYVVSTSNVAPTGAGTATTATFATISGLIPQTTYYIFLRSKCSATDTSSWNGPISFVTNCANVTSYIQNFDAVTVPNLPACWAKVGADGTVNTQTATPNSGPNTMYFYSFGVSAVVSTQQVSNLGAGTHRIKFDMRANFTVGGIIEYGYLTNPLDSSTFVALTSFTASSLTYASYQFSPPAGTYSDFPAFRHTGTPGNSVLIDNVIWETNPSCLDQTGVVVGGITSSGANISWDAITGTIGYEYEVTTSATPPASGTPITATFTTVSGLNPQTLYYVHVRPKCSATSFGAWATVNFTTACAPVTTFPVVEPFTTFLPSQCWLRGDNGTLAAGPDTFGTNGFYQDGFANVGFTGAFAYNIFVASANDWIISPQFSIPATGYELKFDAAAVNYAATTPVTNWEADDFVEVLVSSTSTTNWTVLYTFNNSNVPSNTGSLYVIDLDAYAGQTVRFAYRVVEGTADGASDLEFSVDNFTLRLSPTCPDQTGLVVGGITSSGANTSWDALTGVSGYEYAVTTSVTPPASGTATTNAFAVVSGLAPQTLHYLHVRATCSGGTFGNWATISFTTACVPVSTLPWTEGFEGVTPVGITNFPSCWFKQSGNYSTAVAGAYNTPNTGTNYLRAQYGSNNDFMWTPGFNLVAGTSYDFSSFIQGDNGNSWTIAYFVNSAQNSTGATQLGSNYAVPGAGAPYSPQNYVNVARSFIPTTTGTYYFAVRVNEPTFGPWYVAFDDFEVKLSPACLPPAATVSNVTSNSATLTWNAFAGAASGYEYVLDNVATNPTGAGIATTALTYAATTLTSATTYYFHIRSACSSTDFSAWSTISFTTPCVAGGVPYTQDFEGATTPNLPLCTTQQNVGTGNLWNTTNNPGYGFTTNVLRYTYNSGADANVWFYTNGINLVAGTAYKISYDYGSTGTTYPEKLKVAYGTSAQATAMTTPLADHPNVVNGTTPINNIVNFTPATSGVYYFGFNAYSIPNQFYLFVDNIVIDVALANNDFNNKSFSVYPNPVKDVLNIDFTENISKIQVINLLGQEVITKTVNATQNQIDMSGLAKGTYLVKVTSEDLVKTIKVIKE